MPSSGQWRGSRKALRAFRLRGPRGHRVARGRARSSAGEDRITRRSSSWATVFVASAAAACGRPHARQFGPPPVPRTSGGPWGVAWVGAPLVGRLGSDAVDVAVCLTAARAGSPSVRSGVVDGRPAGVERAHVDEGIEVHDHSASRSVGRRSPQNVEARAEAVHSRGLIGVAIRSDGWRRPTRF